MFFIGLSTSILDLYLNITNLTILGVNSLESNQTENLSQKKDKLHKKHFVKSVNITTNTQNTRTKAKRHKKIKQNSPPNRSNTHQAVKNKINSTTTYLDYNSMIFEMLQPREEFRARYMSLLLMFLYLQVC